MNIILKPISYEMNSLIILNISSAKEAKTTHQSLNISVSIILDNKKNRFFFFFSSGHMDNSQKNPYINNFLPQLIHSFPFLSSRKVKTTFFQPLLSRTAPPPPRFSVIKKKKIPATNLSANERSDPLCSDNGCVRNGTLSTKYRTSYAL